MKKAILTVLAVLLFTTTARAVITLTPISVTVTNASSTILEKSTWGRDVFIQNNDTTGIIYLSFSGAATVSGAAVKLDPGDSFTALNIANAIQAIGSIASNANVAVLEGR